MRGFPEISGAPRYTQAEILGWLRSRKANDSCRDMVMAIFAARYEYPAEAPAPDFLCVQFCHETGFATWGGGAKRWNPAGIKLANASGDGARDFERPATPEAAAHMLYNHWASLLDYEPIPPVHGRYAVARSVYQGKGVYGKIETIDDLGGGIWAMDPAYAPKLRKYLEELEERA